jgi:hypothetical protein
VSTPPLPTRFVECATCTDGLATQHLGLDGEWRPKPPLCGECLDRNAERVIGWLEERRRRILAGVPQFTAEDLLPWKPPVQVVEARDG